MTDTRSAAQPLAPSKSRNAKAARLVAASTTALLLAGCSGLSSPSPRGVFQPGLAPPPPGHLAAADPQKRIAELQSRLDRLERRLSALGLEEVVAGSTGPVGAPMGGSAGGGRAGWRSGTAAAGSAAGSSFETAQGFDPAQGGQPQGQSRDVGGAVSDEDLNRALSRTLVEQGGLVLPPYVAEVTPDLSYEYQKRSGLQIFNANGQTTIGPSDARRDTVTAGVTGRLGLPYSSQAELRVPFAYERNRVDALGRDQSKSKGGIGDVQLTLSKQLLREKGLIPDLLGAVSWTAPTGNAKIGVGQPSLGNGYHSLRAGLTAVKGQDPLVFLGGLAYTKNFSATISGANVEPGDIYSARFGTILAVSPETSLRTILNTDFYNSTKVNGVKSPGSDRVSSVLELGLATVLSERALLDISAGIGVTDDAPDFRIGVSLPYRF